MLQIKQHSCVFRSLLFTKQNTCKKNNQVFHLSRKVVTFDVIDDVSVAFYLSLPGNVDDISPYMYLQKCSIVIEFFHHLQLVLFCYIQNVGDSWPVDLIARLMLAVCS